MRKVLLIEDDRNLAEAIVERLATQRFEVEWVSSGLDGLRMAREWRPDALIVDRRPSGMDGLGIIQRLRQEEIRIPILMLSPLDAVEDRVLTLRAGGDDYLIKPFALIELVARLDALLRRPMEVRETTLRIGTLELDLIERKAKRRNRQIELLPREFRLLEYMMRRSGQLLTRSMLLKEVWNYNFDAKTNLVDVHMGRLRHKVDGPHEVPMIYNIRGAGFILREAVNPAASAPVLARAGRHQDSRPPHRGPELKMTKVTSTPVAIVVPQNAQSLDISGPSDAFLEANRQAPGRCNYEVRLLSTSWDRNVTAGGMSLMAHGSIFDDDEPIDTLLVAGTPDYAQAYEEPIMCTSLRRHALRSRRYGSHGTGVFFLGAAGLLDGLNVTTHWQHTSELAEKFPAAKVSLDRVFVQDGALCTSAGVAAGIDLALKLIEDDHGQGLALSVARRLVVFLKRPGGQSQVSAHLAAQATKEGRVQALQHWILEHLQLRLTLKMLAVRTAMSLRNFTRVFQAEAGITPANFVETARVDRARRLLEDTDKPLKCVAALCGFTNRDTMRRAFMRRIGTGPNEYRDRFRRQGSTGLPDKPSIKPPPAKAFRSMRSPGVTPPGLPAARCSGRVRDHHAS